MNWTAPGKVFLLGEYAVLADEPALILSIGPRFALVEGESGPAPHPDSPTGRLLEWLAREKLPRPHLRFRDAHAGAGGFGASTAEFALFYYAAMKLAELEASSRGARKLYRELLSDAPLVPSGADLAAQCEGGLVRFDPRAGEALRLRPAADLARLLVFSASAQPGRKVPTHSHLTSLAARGFPRPQDCEWAKSMATIVERGITALETREGGFGASLNDYADRLATAGFECEATGTDRLALRALPGVEGCKGSGALQADVLIVWLAEDVTPEQKFAVLSAARARGLNWVEGGSTYVEQAGVTCS